MRDVQAGPAAGEHRERPRAVGPTRRQRRVRGALVAAYLLLILLGWTAPWQPRVFWTMLLPLLVLAIVLMGFPLWRNLCPLAFFGELTRVRNRGTQRRVPEWLERWFFVVLFGLLLAMLVLRLVATNGDGRWLAGLLVALALAAAASNWFFTGKTWCNFFCPVGLIERIYTEPSSLPRNASSSQCRRCTACKRACPDIDQENAYWRDLTSSGRRFAVFAFPGLVLAFYVYFWLRHGDWEAYFDGRWTLLPASAELALGPGFFFAPQVPAVVAATLTLVALSLASYALFRVLETGIGLFVAQDERRRHLALSIAAFTAFNVFYLFAGAPTLRKLPGGPRALAFVAPLVATMFLVKRWPRTRERFVRERSVAAMARNLPLAARPPEGAEVSAWIRTEPHDREQRLTAYVQTLRDILADGLVGGSELRLLEEVREQLGISPAEHARTLALLSEEERDLLERDRAASIERRVQLEGYRTALTEALLRKAPENELAELRQAFGVNLGVHQALLAQLRSASGELLAKARSQLARAQSLGRGLATVGAADQPGAAGFLSYLLLRAQEGAIERLLDLLALAGDADRVHALRPSLFSSEAATRRTAVQQLADACPAAGDLIRQLETLVVERAPQGAAVSSYPEMLQLLAVSPNLYLRAAAVWAAGSRGEPALEALVSRALEDPQPLVRETAALARRPPRTASISDLSTIEKMQFLRGAPLFAALDPEDLHEISLLSEERLLDAGAVLCAEGDVVADDVFILVHGQVSVAARGGGAFAGAERETAVLGPGEVIGELAILDGSPRSATVRAKGGPIRFLRIPGHGFRRLLQRPRLAESLLTTLAGRVRRLSHLAADAPRPERTGNAEGDA